MSFPIIDLIKKESSLNKNVGEWLKDNGFNIDWDGIGGEVWWNIYNENDQLTIQIDKRIPFDEFFKLVSMLSEDIHRQDLPDEYIIVAENLEKAHSLLVKIEKAKAV